MPLVCRYVALHVPELRAAEEFYCRALGLPVLFREATKGNDWLTLPVGKGWEAADEAGIELGMVALSHDDFVLALFPGSPTPGSLYEICLGLEADRVDALGARLPDGAEVVERRPGLVRFVDPYGFRWVVQDLGLAFRSSGEIGGRWLEL